MKPGLSKRNIVRLSGKQRIENLPLLLKELQRVRRRILARGGAIVEEDHSQPTQQFYYFEGDLIQYSGKAVKEGAIMNVTKISLGEGAIFSGNVTTAEFIQHSFDKASSSDLPKNLQELVRELVGEVARLCERLDAPKAQATSRVLEGFVTEVVAPHPSKDWMRITGKGLIEAAKTVAELAVPVTTAVLSILKLFGISCV